ncbi:MAG: hypothetical protein N4A33_02385 [Bacteriovoracaceae bacterium]|jgi:hypothetical protein|nr:hypothetical protein [Bacteriovoracaceae bacterium]
MKLIHFAHPGEASEFLKFFNAKSTQDTGIYLTKSMVICISKEGVFNTCTKLAYICGKFEITSIVNLGIAGSLDNLSIGSIYPVRTCYYFDEKINFKSYSTNSDSHIDCISTNKRVLDNAYAKKLSHFAHIVDMESWACAMVAKDRGLCFSSYKLISDEAGNNTHCLDIKNKSSEYSIKLLTYFLDLNTIIEQPKHTFQIPFHVSFYNQKLIHKLIEKLLLKDPSIQIEELFKKALENQDNKNDKQKAKISINYLTNYLSPIEKKIQNTTQKIFKDFNKGNINIELDKNLEKKQFKITTYINDQKNIDDLIITLQNFKFQTFDNFLNGDLDV